MGKPIRFLGHWKYNTYGFLAQHMPPNAWWFRPMWGDATLVEPEKKDPTAQDWIKRTLPLDIPPTVLAYAMDQRTQSREYRFYEILESWFNKTIRQKTVESPKYMGCLVRLAGPWLLHSMRFQTDTWETHVAPALGKRFIPKTDEDWAVVADVLYERSDITSIHTMAYILGKDKPAPPPLPSNPDYNPTIKQVRKEDVL